MLAERFQPSIRIARHAGKRRGQPGAGERLPLGWIRTLTDQLGNSSTQSAPTDSKTLLARPRPILLIERPELRVLPRKMLLEKRSGDAEPLGHSRRGTTARIPCAEDFPKSTRRTPEMVRIRTAPGGSGERRPGPNRWPRRPSGRRRQRVGPEGSRAACEHDPERGSTQAHADSEQEVEARRPLALHPVVDSVPAHAEVLGQGLDPTSEGNAQMTPQEVRETKGSRLACDEALRREHAGDSTRRPPLPPSRVGGELRGAGVAENGIRRFEGLSTAAAVAERDDLGDETLRLVTVGTERREAHPVFGAAPDRTHAPQQGLPRLLATTAPFGETQRTPAFRPTPVQRAIGAGHEKTAPRQQRVQVEMAETGQQAHRAHQCLSRPAETVIAGRLRREKRRQMKMLAHDSLGDQGAHETIEDRGRRHVTRKRETSDEAGQTLQQRRPEPARRTTVQRQPGFHDNIKRPGAEPVSACRHACGSADHRTQKRPATSSPGPKSRTHRRSHRQGRTSFA